MTTPTTYLPPGPNDVTPARAQMLVLHAIHVQGGVSDPEREAARARQQLAHSPGSIDWDLMEREVQAAVSRSFEQQPAPEPPAVTIVAPPESRLEQLQALYPLLKAKADAASKEFKDCTDAIKLELTTAAPGQTRVDLAGTEHMPALALTYSESWRVDSKRLKAEQAFIYASYAKKSGSWSLREATS